MANNTILTPGGEYQEADNNVQESKQYLEIGRSPGHGPAGQRHHPRRVLQPDRAGQARRYGGDAAHREGHPPPGHHDRGRLPERTDRGYGPGLLHQQYAAPARYRP